MRQNASTAREASKAERQVCCRSSCGRQGRGNLFVEERAEAEAGLNRLIMCCLGEAYGEGSLHERKRKTTGVADCKSARAGMHCSKVFCCGTFPAAAAIHLLRMRGGGPSTTRPWCSDGEIELNS